MSLLLRLLIFLLVCLLLYGVYQYNGIEFFENPPIDAINIDYHNYLNNVVKSTPTPLIGLENATKSVNVANQPYMEGIIKIDNISQPGGIEYDPNGPLQIGLTRAKTICERVTSPDPSAFNNPEFNKFCGLSFDLNGRDCLGNRHKGGGLYIDPDEKTYIPENGIYIPSLGKSTSFAINKETAEFMQKDLACKKSQAVDPAKSCTMCFSDDSFHALESAPVATSCIIGFYTNAMDLIFNQTKLLIGGAAGPKCTVKSITINERTYMHVISPSLSLKEGDAITIQASHPDPTFPIVLAGYIQNSVKDNPDYKFDINMIINRPNGTTIGGSINGYMQYNKFYKNTSIVLEGMMPFTFIPAGPDSDSCSNGPFITKTASANFIQTDHPCYGPGAKPGNYSLACLQQLFLAAGGTTSGSGYPSDATKARVLLLDQTNGKARTLSNIGQMLYDKSMLASTGLTNGISATLKDWNNASVFLTGTPILNPCQTLIPGAPLSSACLSYLYNKSKCAPEGTFNPDHKKPLPNELKAAQKKGNADAVRAFYELIHRTANNDALNNLDRYNAFMGCYGIELKQT